MNDRIKRRTELIQEIRELDKKHGFVGRYGLEYLRLGLLEQFVAKYKRFGKAPEIKDLMI